MGSGTVKEDTADQTIASGKLTVTDADSGEAVLVAKEVSNEYGTFKVNADGTWSFTLDNSKPAVQALAEGQKVELGFDVVSKDGTGKATVKIDVLGSNDGATVGQGKDDVGSGTVKEDTADQTIASGKLTVTDADSGEAVLVAKEVSNEYGTFKVNADGTGASRWTTASRRYRRWPKDRRSSWALTWSPKMGPARRR